jgi:hypothetical protein
LPDEIDADIDRDETVYLDKRSASVTPGSECFGRTMTMGGIESTRFLKFLNQLGPPPPPPLPPPPYPPPRFGK